MSTIEERKERATVDNRDNTDNSVNAIKQPNLARGVFAGGQIQAVAIMAKDIVNEAIRCHDLLPLPAAALGRTLMGAILLGVNLKNEDTVTLRIKGGGPIQGLLAQARAGGQVRGYVGNPALTLPKNAQGKLDVGKAVGTDGFLYVTKDMGLGEPYTGTTALVSGEIAEDLAAYFQQSEQAPVVVALGVLIDVDGSCLAAGGFLIKGLPGIGETTLAELEQWLLALPPISVLAHQLDSAADLLQALFPREDIQAENHGMALEEWQYRCDCRRQRLEQALISLGAAELTEMLEEDGKAQLRCHFCNKTYDFSSEDLMRLIGELGTGKKAVNTGANPSKY